ncbi:cellulose binding domain-containing protein [Dactylosporangium sp. CS-033363]|uniref:cellulose binding domain-containing protein n=1 Tax=Dactylosporangium sp. CS-033363 TaxID=3239935 RepID=UPI003D89FD64
MGAHLRLRIGVSLAAVVVAAVAASVLPGLPGAIALVAAACTAGALLGWPGAIGGLLLLFLADGIAAQVAVVLAGVLAPPAMWAWRRWTVRERRIRAHAAAAERDRVAVELPETLDMAPLPDLVAGITEEWSARTGIGVILHSAGLEEAGDMPPRAGIELGWILSESLGNVAAHARAETVAVTLGRDGDGIMLEVRDDGVGFASAQAAHRGIAGMQERARACGGQLTVWSRPGQGTRVTAVFPAAQAAQVVAGPTWRVRLGAGLAAAVVPLVVIAAFSTSGGLTTPLAADDGQLPFDPNATHGPATALPASEAGPGRASSTASPTATASRGASVRPSDSAAPTGTGTGPGVPPPPAPPPGTLAAEQRSCRVTYVKRTEWNPGFVADVTLTNLTGAELRGWTLRFDYPGGQKVTSYWNAIASQSGTAVTVRPTGDQPTVAAGGSLTFGIQGTWQGANPNPPGFTVNGSPCG